MSDVDTPSSEGAISGGAPARTYFIPSASQINEMARNATRGRPLTPEERDGAIRVLKDAMEHSRSYRTRITAGKALAVYEALDLRDLHHTERLQHEAGILDLRLRRADEGKPSEIIGIQISPSEELPLPKSLADYRLKGMLPAPGKN
jgi:hypothetical protein